VPLNWTAAQKGDSRNFSTGQVLGFHRAVKGIAKNETLEVVRVVDKSVLVRNAVGEERTLTTKQAKSFDIYERRSIEVATGDRLLLTANRRENGFRVTNGEIVTVSGVDPTGRIGLEDGRVLPAGFRHFTHGYAVTAHRSQGKSVDAVIISGDGMRKELFYVAASRGRQSVQVITSDKELLRESVARSSARKSASELARKAGTVFVRVACRGMVAARQLAMRLSTRETEPLAQAEMNYQYEPRTERYRERGFGR
jgi:ATP-dependent exoDNAse (exonuclease V) alpha subunit